MKGIFFFSASILIALSAFAKMQTSSPVMVEQDREEIEEALINDFKNTGTLRAFDKNLCPQLRLNIHIETEPSATGELSGTGIVFYSCDGGLLWNRSETREIYQENSSWYVKSLVE